MRALPVRAEQTPAEIVRVESQPLSLVNLGQPNNAIAQAIIASTLVDLTGYFGVIWSDQQVKDCAELWATSYYWMTQSEIKLFIQWLKSGRYTKSDYRHLSPFQLMGWLEEYTDALIMERGAFYQEKEAEERRRKEHERMTDPIYLAFDLGRALAAIGRTPEDILAEREKEEDYLREKAKQKERDQQALNNQNPET